MAPTEPQISGPGFRHFRFNHRREGADGLKIFGVEIALHQLDTEMPFNFQDQLENIDGIDLQRSP